MEASRASDPRRDRVASESLAGLQSAQLNRLVTTVVVHVVGGAAFFRFTALAGLIAVAPPTVERFIERVNRLYEQGASLRCIGEYVRRWTSWVVSGLGNRFGAVSNVVVLGTSSEDSLVRTETPGRLVYAVHASGPIKRAICSVEPCSWPLVSSTANRKPSLRK